MGMNVVCIIVLSAWSALVSGQHVPASPCPDIFSYNINGDHIYGRIRYQPPGSTKYIFMRATFVIEAELPSNYSGQLEVQGARAFVLLRMLRGQSLNYRVEFPLANPLPTLAAITVNGDELCSGEEETPSHSKSYSLEHLLFDKGDEDLSIIILGTSENRKPITTPKPIQPSGTGAGVECGLVSGGNEQVELVHRGKAVSPGQWPWLVAIFAKFSKSVKYICAGSLVSNQHVITAAHCMSRLGVVKAKEDFVLKLGAFNLDNTNDPQVVTRGVKSAAIHFYYDSHSLANDLLVLILDSPVTFTEFIRPVCLWESGTDLNGIINKYGTVVGWGGNELRESGTGEPRMASLPIVSTETCRGSRKEFHDLTSRTTICVGNRNGTGPCNGDSGGGLYMLSGGRWRLRGLVSVSLRPVTGEAKCNLDEYVVLTDVAQYLTWVRQHLAGIPAPSLMPLPMKGGTVPKPHEAHEEGATGCGVVAGANERGPLLSNDHSVSPGDWPWLVAIYYRKGDNKITLICTGSLISNRHVVTAAQCHSSLQFVVKLGRFNLSASSHPHQRSRNVVTKTVHESYVLIDSKTRNNNVAIFTLETSVDFTPYIRPVCLWEETSDRDLVGQSGMMVGWGRNEVNIDLGGEVRAASVPIVSNEECHASRQFRLFDNYNNTFCAGQTNGTRLCFGDAGGGLFMMSGGRWRLRGVIHRQIDPDAVCSVQNYAIFTDIIGFVPWIRKHINMIVEEPVVNDEVEEAEHNIPSHTYLGYGNKAGRP